MNAPREIELQFEGADFCYVKGLWGTDYDFEANIKEKKGGNSINS
jgi:hypothetical protein